MRTIKVTVASTLDHPTQGEIDVLVTCGVTPGWAGTYYDPPEGPEVWIERIDTNDKPSMPIDVAFLDNCADPKDRFYRWYESIVESAIDLAQDDGPEYEPDDGREWEPDDDPDYGR